MKFDTFWRLKFTKITKFKGPRIAKIAILELLDSPKLISLKNWVADNHKKSLSEPLKMSKWPLMTLLSRKISEADKFSNDSRTFQPFDFT